ncbi:Gfo/Idh/MocA family protein [Planctomicrobium sp. SH664]|uniref:Gfo/Idh/MocA family protein n=1 Tax=Planctomicrobium sp. SH664 TaxID=3448125 RepID=UPI003F5C3D56
MSLTRRYFLQAAAAVSTAAVTARQLHAAPEKTSSSPNEKLGVAVIGTGARSGSHLEEILKRDDLELLYLCDADEAAMGRKLKGIQEAKKGGASAKLEQSYQKVLDDKNVDLIFTATPNHWHALISILSMQAGKHVYVEKPVSHNVWEGRQAYNWARKLNKICQSGTQSRASEGLRDAVAWVQAGNLGKIQYAIGTCYKPRPSIGKLDKPLQIPNTVDYDLWCGPAEMVDLYRPKLHYDWHWDFNTGNGDMGNQGIHQMDIARWFLGENELSPRVMSIGGRVGYDDAGDTPNTQIVYHAYEKAPLIFETRGLPHKNLDYKSGMDDYRGSRVGVVVQCEKGFVVIPSYTAAKAFNPDGTELKAWNSKGNSMTKHIGNFIDAVRSGKHEELNADILEGHLSSALCHTGAISHLLGEKRPAAEIEREVASDAVAADSFRRMAEHLANNGVNISDATLTVGPWLEMDPKAETFKNNAKANALLTRAYRKGYVVPDAGQA